MKSGAIYENIQMPGVYIRVDVMKYRNKDYIYLTVSWMRKDDITKKLVDMDVQQDMVVPVGEVKFYRRVL